MTTETMLERKEEHEHKHDEHSHAHPHEHKHEEVKGEEIKTETKEEKIETKKSEKKHAPKKTEAVINGLSLSMSTKKAMGICKFIKGKTIPKAIADLEQVVHGGRVVPMKGEYAHQKGKGISSGKFPVKAAGIFINLLKGLAGNANVSGLEEPIIAEAVANLASRPFGKYGAVRRKKTHVKIVAKEKKVKAKKEKK